MQTIYNTFANLAIENPSKSIVICTSKIVAQTSSAILVPVVASNTSRAVEYPEWVIFELAELELLQSLAVEVREISRRAFVGLVHVRTSVWRNIAHSTGLGEGDIVRDGLCCRGVGASLSASGNDVVHVGPSPGWVGTGVWVGTVRSDLSTADEAEVLERELVLGSGSDLDHSADPGGVGESWAVEQTGTDGSAALGANGHLVTGERVVIGDVVREGVEVGRDVERAVQRRETSSNWSSSVW